MTEPTPANQFEDNLLQSFNIPSIRPEFVEELNDKLMTQAARKSKKTRRAMGMHPVLAFLLLFTLLLIAGTLIIGPKRVYAEVSKLLGYIPGAGIVDQNSPLRILKEPVTITQNGVTISVTSVILTSEKTFINYEITGVPLSAYPQKENGKGGCMEPAYLLLPDGTKLLAANEMEPLPANVKRATLIFPCVFNTLPHTVPTNWVLHLQFIPIPANKLATPVITFEPSPEVTSQYTINHMNENPLKITQIMEFGNQYVVQGEFQYSALGEVDHDNVMKDGSIWVITDVKITDKNGKEYPNLPANDIPLTTSSQPNSETWNLLIDKGFSSPLLITYETEHIAPVGMEEQAKFEFNVGQSPQDGDKWKMNQSFQLGGYHIQLISITYSSNFGYEFQFLAQPEANNNWITVSIDGFTPNCGGGSGGDYSSDQFSKTFCIVNNGTTTFPTGNLTGILTFQAVKKEKKTFQVKWNSDSSQ